MIIGLKGVVLPVFCHFIPGSWDGYRRTDAKGFQHTITKGPGQRRDGW